MKLTVCSYNIHRCIGTDGLYSPKRINDVLHGIDADIVALQEVDIGTASRSGECHATFFAAAHTHHCIPAATEAFDRGYGNAVLTDEPPKGVRRMNLTVQGKEPRGGVKFVYAKEGKEVHVVTTHLGLDYKERTSQFASLLDEVPLDGSCILLGDFNEWLPVSPHIRKLQRTFSSAPLARTFPTQFPVLALDRIFVRGGRVLTSGVVKTPLTRVASDHFPIVAELELSL